MRTGTQAHRHTDTQAETHGIGGTSGRKMTLTLFRALVRINVATCYGGGPCLRLTMQSECWCVHACPREYGCHMTAAVYFTEQQS